MPRFCNSHHLIESQTHATVVVASNRLLNSYISCGKHVWPYQVKYQEHLCGPTTDPFYLDQRVDYGLVIHSIP